MTQPMALPSSDELWSSLKTQMLMELQRLARERRLTRIEMREWMLMQTMNLTTTEQAWLKQTRRLVSVMPPLPPPPKDLVPRVSPRSSMLTLSNLEVQNPPSTLMLSNTLHLPAPNDLIRRIFPLGLLP